MKVATQSSGDLIHLGTLLEKIPVAMLTNLDPAGNLVSRPMSVLEMDGSGALWLLTDRRSAESKNLLVLNLAFTDPARAVYVSLSGHGEINSNPDHIKALWSVFARPWFPDGPESSNLALLKFIPDQAEYWDAPHNKMVRLFAMAASVVAGRPIGLGEHDRLSNLSPPVGTANAAMPEVKPAWRYAV